MQSDSSIMQLVSPVILMHSRLYELGLQAKDVGGYQGKSGPGKIHAVILVSLIALVLRTLPCRNVITFDM